MSKNRERVCGLAIVVGFERSIIWCRTKSKKKRRVDFGEKGGEVRIYAPTKKHAVRLAHKAHIRAVSPRTTNGTTILIGLVGGWGKLARYQFKHGLP